jgi:hypothetical protein
MTSRKTKDPGLIAFYQLIMLAFFFAMRSCEYLKLPKGSDRRTKTLRVKNLVFRKNKKFLTHDDPNLHLADSVTITFEFQKKQDQHDQVTHSRSKDDKICPVTAAAAIVKRLRAMGATEETSIYKYQDKNGVTRDMTNTVALRFLRSFIKTVDPAYGIAERDIGIHSIRASAAMAMYMNGISTSTIMLLGRWSSDAFLLYIRKTVEEFSNDVAAKMISNRVYHTVDTRENQDDPRSHNPMAATANLGMGSNGPALKRGAFSLWE